MSTSEPIALKAHQPSSSNDSKNDSTESELSRSTYQSQSTTSLPATTSTSTTRITFAPLPPIEPRKRRSTSQIRLGVAARSSMMRNRRLENLNNGDREEGWGGALKRVPPSSELCQDEETECPRANTRRARPIDPEDPLLAVGRMVKSAWRRVSQTRMSQPTPPNGNRHDMAEEKKDATQLPPETERSDCERQILYTHEESAKAKQVSSDKEDEGLGAPGNAPIRNSSFDFQKPVLVRSASEPWGNKASVAPTFGER